VTVSSGNWRTITVVIGLRRRLGLAVKLLVAFLNEMAGAVLDFGFYPGRLELSSGPLIVRSLPDHEHIASEVLALDGIDRDWIYSPPERVRDFMSGQVSEKPYGRRVFGLPKTHQIEHSTDDDTDRLTFHL
jgi:hypothetical protein